MSYEALETLFKGKDVLGSDSFYVSSVSDLLFIVERFKKNQLDISSENLKSQFKFLNDKAEDEGVINFIELDKDVLFNSLFEESDEGVLSLDRKASNMKISPRFSISLLCFKVNEINCYWDYDVFNDMEANYLKNESYGW